MCLTRTAVCLWQQRCLACVNPRHVSLPERLAIKMGGSEFAAATAVAFLLIHIMDGPVVLTAASRSKIAVPGNVTSTPSLSFSTEIPELLPQPMARVHGPPQRPAEPIIVYIGIAFVQVSIILSSSNLWSSLIHGVYTYLNGQTFDYKAVA